MKTPQIQANFKHKTKRKLPNAHAQGEILASQKNCCFYCGNAFGTVFVKRFVNIQRTPNWDHIAPYCMTFDNSFENFAAACQECNSIKGCILFNTFIEAATYVRARREEKGYVNMPVWGNAQTQRAHKKDMVADATYNGVFSSYDASGLTDEELRVALAKTKFLLKNL